MSDSNFDSIEHGGDSEDEFRISDSRQTPRSTRNV